MICALTLQSAFAQTYLTEHQWTAVLKAVDEIGRPVAGANILVGYSIYTTNQIAGLTDTNGIFIATHRDATEYLSINAEKAGYYPFSFSYFKGDYKPDRWNPTVTILLKKIEKPISMYAKKEESKVPKENEPVGFDLMIGDWVGPYGKGVTADLFFAVQRKIVSERQYDAELKLTFPNTGDGVVVLPPTPDTGSPLKMPRVAAEGGYESSLVWHYTHTQRPEPVLGYFFRVRTILDEKGNIQSALYGKIQGNIRFYVGTIAPHAGLGFDYYLNPTPNSRNVEFDPKQNLFKNLSPLEKVTAP